MNTDSFNATQRVHEYLIATGDTLNANVCRALGLPYGKHYLHDLRRRIASLDAPRSVCSGNHSANGSIGSSLSSAVALKKVIEELPSKVFSTNDLRDRIQVSNSVMSKALKKLEVEGIVERVASSRPYRYRRLSKPCSDFTEVFMESHGMNVLSSAISVRSLSLLANRALCGMTLEGINIPSLVTDLTSHYARISLPTPPRLAIEPFLLAVLKGGGDYRAIIRELEKSFREAKTVRRAFKRLACKDGLKSPLEDYALPTEWISVFEQPGRILSFVEAVTVAIGSEFYFREAEMISEETIKITMEELRSQGLVDQYDSSKKAVIDIAPSFHDQVLAIIHHNIHKCVKMVDLPVRKYNTKDLYQKIKWEIIQNKNHDKTRLDFYD